MKLSFTKIVSKKEITDKLQLYKYTNSIPSTESLKQKLSQSENEENKWIPN